MIDEYKTLKKVVSQHPDKDVKESALKLFSRCSQLKKNGALGSQGPKRTRQTNLAKNSGSNLARTKRDSNRPLPRGKARIERAEPKTTRSNTLTRPIRSHFYLPGHDRPSLVTNKWHSLASFRKATQWQGLTEKSHLAGSTIHELEMVRKGKRAVRIYGREFLGQVDVSGTNGLPAPQEEYTRLGAQMGMYPVLPSAISGRLRLLAMEFEQHKALRARIYYQPIVPATTPGAIALAFVQDVGEEFLEVGRDELSFLSTHPSFCQTNVWESCHIDVDPSNMLRKYWNEESSSFRQSAQGTVVVASASDLRGDAVGTVYQPKVYGNLFVEYEFEFFEAQLNNTIENVHETQISLQTGSQTGAYEFEQGDSMVFFPVGSAYETSNPSLAYTLTGGSADFLNNPQEYIGVGVCQATKDYAGGSEYWWQGSDAEFTTPTSSTQYSWAIGQALYFRWAHVEAANGYTYIMFAFSSLEEAGSFIGPGNNLQALGTILLTSAINFTPTETDILGPRFKTRIWKILDRA
jgi:hypothetical protein